MPGFRQRRGGQRERHANTRARYGTFGAHLYDMRVIFAVMALTTAWSSAWVFPSGSTAVQPVAVTRGSGTTKATCTLIGDRDTSMLDGCIGAPADAGGGTFGLVTSCEPGKAPKITLFRAARSFIERNPMSALTAQVATLPANAQVWSAPEDFTAIGVDPLADASTTSVVEIRITRWSAEAEKGRFARTLLDHGPEALLAELRDSRPVGLIKSPESLPWALRFAWQEWTPDGGRQILILTDRPIGIWEVALGFPSLQYPFSLIELRLNADGEGEGKLWVATGITVDPSLDSIELETYDGPPIQLTEVRSRQAT